jgi:hypothetical protein
MRLEADVPFPAHSVAGQRFQRRILRPLGEWPQQESFSGVRHLEISHHNFSDDANGFDANRAKSAVMWEDTECRRTSPWAI